MRVRVIVGHFARVLLLLGLFSAGLGILWYLGNSLIPREFPGLLQGLP